VSDRCGPPLRGADRDVAELPVLRQIAEQHEVAQAVAHWLLVQLHLEDASVELGGRCGIRHDDVEVLETEIVERQQTRCGRLRPYADPERRREDGRSDCQSPIHVSPPAKPGGRRIYQRAAAKGATRANLSLISGLSRVRRTSDPAGILRTSIDRDDRGHTNLVIRSAVDLR
jgi:hypothetical protein